MKCCDITPGMLNRRITFLVKDSTETITGGERVAWVPYKSTYAMIKPSTGREVFFAGGLSAIGTSIVTIRYRDDIDETMTVLYRGKSHQVRSIINLEEADVWMQVLIEKGVSL